MFTMSNLSNEKLMRILYFPCLSGILVRTLFVLCLLALAGIQSVSAQSLPPCTTSLNIPDDNDGVEQAIDIDKDNNGLIEICDLEGLDEMRHQLDGSGYTTSTDATKITDGCPSDVCSGFELMRDLDFEDPASYRSGSTNQAWTDRAGWDPIGVSAFDGFKAAFDGNGHTISNLLINRPSNVGVGFFRSITITGTGRIDNIRLKDVDVTGGENTAGLAGANFGTINNAYVSGTITGIRNVGGMVGVSFFDGVEGGGINNSYTIVTVSGGTSNLDLRVGGLVGNNQRPITNSYAIADVSGIESIGGLVGSNDTFFGIIRNSFAIATVRGNEFVGGLVGALVNGMIFNSYARGSVFATDTHVGGLVGWISNPDLRRRQRINNSYSIVEVAGGATTTIIGGLVGRRVMAANALVNNSYWDSQISGQDTSDGGSGKTTVELQEPTTNEGIYASWSTGNWDFGSSTQFPILKASDSDTVLPNQRIGLRGLPLCTLNIPDNDGDEVEQVMDIDKDNNGLIEICDLEGLNAIRHQPDGTGYKASADATKITDGCPSGGCTGYELTRNLDFNNNASYRAIANRTTWTTGDGWEPIGESSSDLFNATFNGNGYTISNLMINRSSTDGIGLFGYTGSNSDISAVGLLNVDISGQNKVGSLVGEHVGVITNSYATGTVEGAGSNVGGLAGENGANAMVKNSCATSTVSGSGSQVGGLVGNNFRGTITNSCATGTVLGSGSNIGGLVGQNQEETIRNSYATGTVSGSGSDIGGLVGFNNTATIENSYATGDVKGSDSSSNVGGLVGQNDGTTFTDSEIKNSYATGSVSGGGSSVGGLVGRNDTGRSMITGSYWLRGSASSGGTGVDANTEKTAVELISPTANEGIYSTWNPNDWDFGTSNQFPVIRNSGSDVLTNLPLCTLNIVADDRDNVKHAMDIDKDNDGLIEICDVEGLDEMRYQLDGAGYKTTDSEMVIAMTAGCPSDGCKGYELARSLDFMANNSYRPATNEATWTAGDGWQPIGDFNMPFNAIFDGNGHTISNLMINRSRFEGLGLFGYAGSNSILTSVGLLNVDISGQSRVGGLVGLNEGTITNSYTMGVVSGTGLNIGGLVGSNSRAAITNSYGTITVEGSGSNVGGLAGANSGTITNSYATGTISESNERIGGLVGFNGTTITNSYVTARSVSGSGSNVGGLAGENTGTINDSYWQRGSANSAGTGVATDTSKAAMEIRAPTRAEGIYRRWSPGDWDFGTSNQFPVLKYAKGIDTNYPACSDTPPQTSIDQPQCETLLPNQEMNIGDSGLRESLRELSVPEFRTTSSQIFGVSTNNYVVTIFFREGITTNSIVLRLRAYNSDAKIQIFRNGDSSTDYFEGKMSGDESGRIVVREGTKLTIRVSEPDEPDTDYTLTFRVEELQGIQIRVKVFLEGPLQ